ncbi:MAG: DUF3330 domain-containing protein [Pseudomonadota bacterium]|nr:MAG: DUF3330 domain-containing protein [Pseudomonadota bacterium]
MNAMPKPEETPNVACEICMKEIPASEANSSEAQDYVMYFCGLDCYEKWAGADISAKMKPKSTARTGAETR